jgi:hypothetical protein
VPVGDEPGAPPEHPRRRVREDMHVGVAQRREVALGRVVAARSFEWNAPSTRSRSASAGASISPPPRRTHPSRSIAAPGTRRRGPGARRSQRRSARPGP